MEKHRIKEYDTLEIIEHKSLTSLTIFGEDGFIIYESEGLQETHVIIHNYIYVYYHNLK